MLVVNNLSNSNPESLRRVESITGQAVLFYKVDIRDRDFATGKVCLGCLRCIILTAAFILPD